MLLLPAYDVHGIAEICDWVHVMTYDMHSRMDPYTGLNAPFSQQPGDKGPERQYNVVWTVYRYHSHIE